LLPLSAVLDSGTRVASAPLRGMTVTWTLAVNRDRAQRPAVRALAEMIHAHARTLIKERVWKAPQRQSVS
jgi:hypothetical protein